MDKNINVNGDVYGVAVVQSGATVNQNIILPEHKTPKQLTTILGKDTIIGRVQELKEIDTLLKQSSSLLLINGIGGIGKSTIASYYLHSQKENLDYYGFFEGLESFTSELRTNLALQQEKEDDAFIEALSKLRNLKGNKLLVFDDVKDIKANKDKIEKILALKDSGYKILLTSREEIEYIEQYYLDVLSLEDAKELFNSIYQVEDEVLLEDILGYLDYHAFFVEMTAKTLKSKSTLSPKLIKEKFDNSEFPSIKRNRKESFNDYLNKLFSFDELDDEEILMLKQLSVLPSIEIEFAFLQEIFDKKDDEEFEDILNYLCEKGWLSSLENRYKLHQIVKVFILENHSPYFDEIESEINYFNNLIINSDDAQVTIDIKDDFIYFESLLSFMKIKNLENQKIAIFYKNMALVYNYLGKYKQAIFFNTLSLGITIKFTGSLSIECSALYNNLGSIYEIIDEKEEALNFYKKSLEIKEEILGTDHVETAITYDNLAVLYVTMQKYNEAVIYSEKAIAIFEKLLDMRPLDVAKSYDILSWIYQEMEKWKEALRYTLKARKIFQDLGKHSPDTIICNNNLARIYYNIGKKREAISLYKMNLEVSEKTLGIDDMTTAQIYYDLAIFYYAEKKCQDAKEYVLKAFEIKKKALPPKHHIIIDLQNGIKKIEECIKENQKIVLPKKEGRNDPCPCNSGKKYKKCCGKNN